MNRENITNKDIVQFLDYHNRPGRLGLYPIIREGAYPIYKLNMEEDQLCLMIMDFLSTYSVDNKEINHDTFFFRSAIKKGWKERIRRFFQRDAHIVSEMTVDFLTATAQRGVWNEEAGRKCLQHSAFRSAS